MKRAIRSGIAALLVLAAGPAAAVELGFTGSFAFHLSTLDPVVAPGFGVAQATYDGFGAIQRLDLPGYALTTNALTVPVTDPSAAPIKGLYADHLGNETGIFERDANGDVGGSMPLHGNLKVCLFSECSVAVANITVPARVIGHDATTTVDVAVALTVQGAPWTVGTIQAGPGPVTGSDSGSTWNLVTPIMISTNIAPSAVVRPWGVLSLSFGPTGTNLCDNQFDDDGDGLADFPNDPGCSSADDPSEHADGHVCDDGVDNDGDRRIDGADPGCDGPLDASESSPLLACDDDLDDDGDGLVDVDDPGCSGPGDLSEHGSKECDDGLDDDGDGLVDLLDPGCADPFDASERGSGVPCDDGIDDDQDGAADYPADAGCTSIQDPSERSAARVCDDGIDNDGDGRNDYAIGGLGDPGCASTADPSEKSLLFACDDGLDNDHDGLVDVPLDPGCSTPSDVSEQSISLACDDSLDNDGDGKIDSQEDPGCTSPLDPLESVDFADGTVHWIDAGSLPGDGVSVGDDPDTTLPSSLYLVAGGAIEGGLLVDGLSFVRTTGGTIEGDLVASGDAEVDVEALTLLGVVEARDGATITIRGSGFDLPLGPIGALSGTVAGFLVDGTPFTWEFVRDAGAAIVLAPEPGAGAIASVALGALAALRRRGRAAHR